MRDYTNKAYRTATNKGYMLLASEDVRAFEQTFYGQHIIKHPERTIELDILREVTGVQLPNWEDLTERNLKNYRDAVLERLSSNSARTVFAHIKAILNDMKEEVELPTLRFKDILKAKKEPTQNVYLTEKEIEALDKVNTKDDREQYVKACFLISCYCGCRHSDAVRMTAENINENTNTLSYVSQKTRIEASMPCHRNLRKYIGHFDTTIEMWDYEFNDTLRDLCMRAGINGREKVFRGGKERVSEKYELVASHTARRSFVTNLYLRDVDLETIAKMAGHSDSSMTSRYLCCTRELSNKAMAFFN